MITAKSSDGKDAYAIQGSVTEEPPAYDTAVRKEDKGEGGESSQVATLAIIANVEARIGRTTYTRLEDAVNAVDPNLEKQTEIVLVPDEVTKTEKVVINENQNIKLDLDGNILNSTASDYIIENHGKLEIVDTSEEGSGKITNSSESVIYNASTNSENNTEGDVESVNLNAVKDYSPEDEYKFKYDEDSGVIKNTNQSDLNTTAKGYLELDLGKKPGKYTLTIDAEISSNSGTAYVSITNNPDDSDRAATNSSNYGNILNMSNTDSKQQSIDIAGGQKYYMNLRYKRGSSQKAGVDNEFKIKSITLTKKQEGELTLTSGTIEIDKEGKSNTYYSAIKNEGLLNVNGGKITSSKNYTSGVDTLAGGTSNINNGELTLTGNDDRAVWAEGKASLTNVKNGKIEADIGVTTTQCIANINLTGGEYSEDCDYQIYHNATYGLITVDGVTLNSTSKSNNSIYVKTNYSDLIIKDSQITNNKGTALSNNYDYCNVKVDNTTVSGKINCNGMDNSNITLNGCHINNNNNTCISYSGIKSNIEISNSDITSKGNCYAMSCGGKDTNLTIEESSIKSESTNDKYGAMDLTAGGTVYIKGETKINSVGPAICANEDANLELNIVSGTLESTQAQAILMGNTTGNITIGTKGSDVKTDNPVIKSGNSEWTIDSNRMHLNFYDGRLIGTQDKVIAMSVEELENGYDIVDTEDEGENQEQREVLILGHTENVAEVPKGSENSTKYNTLKKAVEECNKDGSEEQTTTIRLLEDINQTEQIKIEEGQNIKIDLNGHKLYAMTDDTIYNKGKLEITDSTKQLETTDSAQELETADSTEEKEADKNIMCFTGVTVIHNAGKTEEDNTTSKGELTIGNGISIYCTKSGMSSAYKTIIKNEGKLNTNNTKIDATGNYIYPIENLEEAEITGGSITTSGSNAYGICNDTSKKLKLKDVNITTNSSTGSYGVYNKKEGTVEIEGDTNISTSVQSIYNYGAGDVTINNATISCKNNSAIYNNDTGKITINGGNITNSTKSYACINNNKDGTIEMHGGTVKGENSYAIRNQSTGSIDVVSGTVISEGASGIYNYSSGTINLGKKLTEEELEKGEEPNVKDPAITGKKAGIENSKGKFNFYDGIVTGSKDQAYSGNVTEKEVGYQIVRKNSTEDTESAILEKVDIIKITDNKGTEKKFSTMSEFEKELQSIVTSEKFVITILADFSMSSSEKLTIEKDMTAELDINGCNIISAADFTIENNGILTIKDSKQDHKGSIKHTVNGSKEEIKCAVKNNKDATLNVDSSTISTTGTYDYGIYNTGKLVINGGEITTNESNAYGIYNSESGQAEITGNKISTKNAHAIYNCSNNKIQISDTNITVTDSNSYGINNDSNGTVIINGETTITTSSISVNNNKEGIITINNGEFKSTGSKTINNNSTGKIEINDGKITSTSTLIGAFGINNNNEGTININNGTVNSKKDGIYNGGGTINITGGTITSESSYGVNNNTSNGTGIINITGGTITSGNSYGVYNQQGELKIGEKIGEETEKKQNETPSTDEPIIQGATYGVYSTGTFNFYDGKIIGEKGKSINPNITDKEKGYQIVKTTDENDKLETAVLQDIEVFEINNKQYKTIEDVQKEIEKNTGNTELTIKVIKDVYMTKSETLEISENKNIVLNLNGHKIETSSDTAIENKGNLTIIGKGDNDEGNNVEGTILGVSKVMIDNKKDLTIDGGTYNSINYDSNNDAKVINNTDNVTWNTGNLILDEGYNYGIYNTGDGNIDWKDGHIRANQTIGKQYGIYTDSSNNVNWDNGDIFLNTTEIRTQYGIYIKGNETGTVNAKKIKFNNIGYSEGASYVMQYSKQYVIYVNDSDAKEDTKIGNITIEDFQRETENDSRRGKVYGICGSYANLDIKEGEFTDFDEAIDLSNSTIKIENGKYQDSISVQKNSNLTITGGNIDTIENHGTVTINNGNINYITTNGTVTMNQGNIDDTDYDSKTKKDKVVEITGGTFTLLGGKINSSTAIGVYIKTGTFTMGDNVEPVLTDTPQVTGATYGVYKETGGEFKFYDGIVKGGNDAISGGVTEQPESYRVKCEIEGENEDTAKSVATLEVDSKMDKVVSVNGMYFEKFETAFSNAVNNHSATIIVYSDITITDSMTITDGSDITINLNGHKITAALDDTIFTNNGNLTIIDEVVDIKEEDEDESTTVAEIENTNGYVVKNEQTLTIGTQGNDVIPETPKLKGKDSAIQNSGIVNWYDGTIDENPAQGEKTITDNVFIMAEAFKANAEKAIEGAKEVIKSIVQKPNIKVDKERPVWTKGPVIATIYTTDRIMLDIINDGGNVQTTSISVKKIWKMSEEEAKNYRATIQVMKMVDGEKQEVKDISGNIITVEIIGNDTQTIKDLPVSENGKKIEYVLEEIKVEKRTSEDADDWEELPVTNFNVTYKE